MIPNLQRTSRNGLSLFVFICFFLSGMTGLIYQVLWTRMIVRIIGSAPFAISIILTVFMAGLGLGSYLAGRWIDRIKESNRLVRLYGLLELVVGCYGLLIPLLAKLSKPLYSIAYNQLQDQFLTFNIVTFIGCFILLVLPVICMGATLPILCRFYVRRLSQLGTYAGRLYGINTVGAAFGALVSGFWLIQWLGITNTLIFAVAINVLIGLTCIVIGGRKVEQAAEPEGQEPAGATYSDVTDADFKGAAVVALMIFGVQGFCAMAYEVIWTKLLGLIVGPTTFSFTIVLVTFILGLALGSMFFGWLADRLKRPFALLIMTQVAAAFCALAASQYFGNSQLVYAKLLSSYQDSFFMLSLMKALTLFAVMVWPTIFLGATFPLVTKIYTQSISRVGHSVGYAYMINTVGCVIGSFCSGFILIPMLGKETSLSLVIALQIVTAAVALVVVAMVARTEKRWRLAWLAVPAALGIILCWSYPSWNHNLLAQGRYFRFSRIHVDLDRTSWWQAISRGSELLSKSDPTELVYYGDGIGGFVSVQSIKNIFGSPDYWLSISGKPDTSSKKDMDTNTLLANLPMLFHPGAKNVMVLGLASGITAGEVLNYPVEKVDILEISPQVVKASDFFRPWNYDVLDNPRAHLIIQDARAHLEHTNQKYDVVISEPSNAWMAGLAALFTTDFFEQAMDRLNDDGIFVQFIYTYEIDWTSFAMIGRSFVEVFPNSMLVSTDPSTFGADYLMIGFKSDGALDPNTAHTNQRYLEKSRNARLANADLLYRMVISEDLHSLFGTGPLNSDDRPRLEFAAPKVMYSEENEIHETIHMRKYLRPQTAAIAQRVVTDPNAQIDFAEYAMSVYEPFTSMVKLSALNDQQKERYLKLVALYASGNEIDGLISDDNPFAPDLTSLCRQVQISVLRRDLDTLPDKPKALAYCGDLLTAEGQFDQAIPLYKSSLELEPSNIAPRINLGVAYYRSKDIDSAIAQFTEVLRLDPEYALAHTYLGHMFNAQGKKTEANLHFDAAKKLEGK